MQEGDGENGVWSTTVELTGYPLARKDSCKPSDRIGNLDRHGIVWAALPRPEAVAAQLFRDSGSHASVHMGRNEVVPLILAIGLSNRDRSVRTPSNYDHESSKTVGVGSPLARHAFRASRFICLMVQLCYYTTCSSTMMYVHAMDSK